MDLLHQFLTEAWKIWLVVCIFFMFVEGLTVAFSYFFVGLGALATAFACYFSGSIAESVTRQLLLFSALSMASLFLLRRRVMKFVHRNMTKFDGSGVFIGKRAKALTNIQKDSIETGKVLFEGTEWMATPSEDSLDILAGSTVGIAHMEGLTLHVRLIKPGINKEDDLSK